MKACWSAMKAIKNDTECKIQYNYKWSLTHKAYTLLTHIQNLYKIQGVKI